MLTERQAHDIATALDGLTAASLTADPQANFSDLSFAIEVSVGHRLSAPVPAWRVDRSRNDFQACAQLQLGQVITPAFFLTALCDHLLHTAERLLAWYDGTESSPLGAGAMAGQQLDWDRERLAHLLGFAKPNPHALVSVASRGWQLELAAECATFGIGMSRFFTDLMNWAGGQYAFVELPDEMAAISSAMPQKKNYPVLERLRGKSSHALSWYVDAATTQRGTPFSNTVEVSKEGSAQMTRQLGDLRSMLRIATAVFRNLRFDTRRLRVACEREYLSAFSLANELTLADGVPWREAQVIAGRYVLDAAESWRPATEPDPEALHRIASEHGHQAGNSAVGLGSLLSADGELERRAGTGSAAPSASAALLAEQFDRISALTADWQRRQEAPEAAVRLVDRLLGLTGGDDR
ncbi:lyase family protein (plasmid) [Streptomyces sp. NBC_01591]|uniref:lyase family protein n=1 Tax=Streptomyces sp. NBC_01591 TaxID=2975888 RepID=UPI002DD94BF9|nr:lyase family protein [Streptomyces sp. NBC_01591]WSD74267.1 lyase family protein [Streptomyces sp. NBC_01591]